MSPELGTEEGRWRDSAGIVGGVSVSRKEQASAEKYSAGTMSALD